MKLILRIDTETKKNTGSGVCPCCYWDEDDQAYFCTVTVNPCAGDMEDSPDDCPLENCDKLIAVFARPDKEVK